MKNNKHAFMLITHFKCQYKKYPLKRIYNKANQEISVKKTIEFKN